MIIFGCDTETYIDGGEGLLSIQLFSDRHSMYFGFEEKHIGRDDEYIRDDICRDFFNFLEEQTESCRIFFFNLRFDFSQFEKYIVNRYEIIYDFDSLKKGELFILQSEIDVYSISFRTWKHGVLIKMQDIMHLTTSSLNDTAKSFLAEGIQKIELGSKIFKKFPANKLQREYAMRDAELTQKIAKVLKDVHGIDLTDSVTIGGKAIKLFRDYIKGKVSGDIMGMPIDPIFRTYENIWEYFDVTYEELEEMEKWLRPYVKGGICQAFNTGIFKGEIIHLDEKSAHPSQMVKRIPFGKILFKKPSTSHTSFVFPSGIFTLKPDGIKCVQWRKKSECQHYAVNKVYKPGLYVEEFMLDGTFGFWEEEWNIILSQYDSEMYKIEKTIYFRTRHDEALTNFVKCMFEGKEKYRDFKAAYLVFKILINAIYGKFLTRPDGKTVIYEHDNEGNVRRKVVSDIGRNPIYLPLGSWIAMMSRVTLMEAAIKVGPKNLLYGDTDSLIFFAYPNWENDFVLGKKLGNWDIDYKPCAVNIVGPKTYQELLNDGTLITKCAGLPAEERLKLGFGDLREGMTVHKNKGIRNPRTLAISIKQCEHTVSTKPQLYRGGH